MNLSLTSTYIKRHLKYSLKLYTQALKISLFYQDKANIGATLTSHYYFAFVRY